MRRCAALNDLGYAVDIFTLDAVHFVPQSRNRLFIVGQPHGSIAERASRQICSPSSIVIPTFSWTIRRLPEPPRTHLAALQEILDKDAEWWERERSAYLLSQMTGQP